MIEQYIGTIGSGKSYHALERILEALKKGKHVIANFPLNFPDGMVRRGYADRFMYVPDEFLMGAEGVAFLYQLSTEEINIGINLYEPRFYGQESQCLVVIDEAGNYFDPMDHAKPEQKLWKTFFTQSRKMGYDFILVSQTDRQVNRTIRACVEYDVVHRKANRVAPFKWLPFTIFMYVTYWKQSRERLGSESSIFVKKYSELYDTHQLFGNFDKDVDFDIGDHVANFSLQFGNCNLGEIVALDEVTGGGAPLGVEPTGDSSRAQD